MFHITTDIEATYLNFVYAVFFEREEVFAVKVVGEGLMAVAEILTETLKCCLLVIK